MTTEERLTELAYLVSYLLKAIPNKVISTQMRDALLERLEGILR